MKIATVKRGNIDPKFWFIFIQLPISRQILTLESSFLHQMKEEGCKNIPGFFQNFCIPSPATVASQSSGPMLPGQCITLAHSWFLYNKMVYTVFGPMIPSQAKRPNLPLHFDTKFAGKKLKISPKKGNLLFFEARAYKIMRIYFSEGFSWVGVSWNLFENVFQIFLSNFRWVINVTSIIIRHFAHSRYGFLNSTEGQIQNSF